MAEVAMLKLREKVLHNLLMWENIWFVLGLKPGVIFQGCQNKPRHCEDGLIGFQEEHLQTRV